MPVGVAEDGAQPFLGDNFKATLKDLEGRMRQAAGDLEFETAARLRDEIKRLKLLDLEFAADVLSGSEGGEDGESARKAARQVRSESRAEAAAAWRRPKRR